MAESREPSGDSIKFSHTFYVYPFNNENPNADALGCSKRASRSPLLLDILKSPKNFLWQKNSFVLATTENWYHPKWTHTSKTFLNHSCAIDEEVESNEIINGNSNHLLPDSCMLEDGSITEITEYTDLFCKDRVKNVYYIVSKAFLSKGCSIVQDFLKVVDLRTGFESYFHGNCIEFGTQKKKRSHDSLENVFKSYHAHRRSISKILYLSKILLKHNEQKSVKRLKTRKAHWRKSLHSVMLKLHQRGNQRECEDYNKRKVVSFLGVCIKQNLFCETSLQWYHNKESVKTELRNECKQLFNLHPNEDLKVHKKLDKKDSNEDMFANNELKRKSSFRKRKIELLEILETFNEIKLLKESKVNRKWLTPNKSIKRDLKFSNSGNFDAAGEEFTDVLETTETLEQHFNDASCSSSPCSSSEEECSIKKYSSFQKSSSLKRKMFSKVVTPQKPLHDLHHLEAGYLERDYSKPPKHVLYSSRMEKTLGANVFEKEGSLRLSSFESNNSDFNVSYAYVLAPYILNTTTKKKKSMKTLSIEHVLHESFEISKNLKFKISVEDEVVEVDEFVTTNEFSYQGHNLNQNLDLFQSTENIKMSYYDFLDTVSESSATLSNTGSDDEVFFRREKNVLTMNQSQKVLLISPQERIVGSVVVQMKDHPTALAPQITTTTTSLNHVFAPSKAISSVVHNQDTTNILSKQEMQTFFQGKSVGSIQENSCSTITSSNHLTNVIRSSKEDFNLSNCVANDSKSAMNKEKTTITTDEFFISSKEKRIGYVAVHNCNEAELSKEQQFIINIDRSKTTFPFQKHFLLQNKEADNGNAVDYKEIVELKNDSCQVNDDDDFFVVDPADFTQKSHKSSNMSALENSLEVSLGSITIEDENGMLKSFELSIEEGPLSKKHHFDSTSHNLSDNYVVISTNGEPFLKNLDNKDSILAINNNFESSQVFSPKYKASSQDQIREGIIHPEFVKKEEKDTFPDQFPEFVPAHFSHVEIKETDLFKTSISTTSHENFTGDRKVLSKIATKDITVVEELPIVLNLKSDEKSFEFREILENENVVSTSYHKYLDTIAPKMNKSDVHVNKRATSFPYIKRNSPPKKRLENRRPQFNNKIVTKEGNIAHEEDDEEFVVLDAEDDILVQQISMSALENSLEISPGNITIEDDKGMLKSFELSIEEGPLRKELHNNDLINSNLSENYILISVNEGTHYKNVAVEKGLNADSSHENDFSNKDFKIYDGINSLISYSSNFKALLCREQVREGVIYPFTVKREEKEISFDDLFSEPGAAHSCQEPEKLVTEDLLHLPKNVMNESSYVNIVNGNKDNLSMSLKKDVLLEEPVFMVAKSNEQSINLTDLLENISSASTPVSKAMEDQTIRINFLNFLGNKKDSHEDSHYKFLVIAKEKNVGNIMIYIKEFYNDLRTLFVHADKGIVGRVVFITEYVSKDNDPENSSLLFDIDHIFNLDDAKIQKSGNKSEIIISMKEKSIGGVVVFYHANSFYEEKLQISFNKEDFVQINSQEFSTSDNKCNEKVCTKEYLKGKTVNSFSEEINEDIADLNSTNFSIISVPQSDQLVSCATNKNKNVNVLSCDSHLATVAKSLLPVTTIKNDKLVQTHSFTESPIILSNVSASSKNTLEVGATISFGGTLSNTKILDSKYQAEKKPELIIKENLFHNKKFEEAQCTENVMELLPTVRGYEVENDILDNEEIVKANEFNIIVFSENVEESFKVLYDLSSTDLSVNVVAEPNQVVSTVLFVSEALNEKEELVDEESVEAKESDRIVFSENLDEKYLAEVSGLSSRTIITHLAAEPNQLVTVDNTTAFAPLVCTDGVAEGFPSLLVSEEKDDKDEVAVFSSVSFDIFKCVSKSEALKEKEELIEKEEPVEAKKYDGIVFSENIDEGILEIAASSSSRDFSIHLGAEPNQSVVVKNAVAFVPLLCTDGLAEDFASLLVSEENNDKDEGVSFSSIPVEKLADNDSKSVAMDEKVSILEVEEAAEAKVLGGFVLSEKVEEENFEVVSDFRPLNVNIHLTELNERNEAVSVISTVAFVPLVCSDEVVEDFSSLLASGENVHEDEVTIFSSMPFDNITDSVSKSAARNEKDLLLQGEEAAEAKMLDGIVFSEKVEEENFEEASDFKSIVVNIHLTELNEPKETVSVVSTEEDISSLLVSRENDHEDDEVASFSSMPFDNLNGVNKSDAVGEKEKLVDEEQPFVVIECDGVVFSEDLHEEYLEEVSDISSGDVSIHVAVASNQSVAIDSTAAFVPLVCTERAVEDISSLLVSEEGGDKNEVASFSSMSFDNLTNGISKSVEINVKVSSLEVEESVEAKVLDGFVFSEKVEENFEVDSDLISSDNCAHLAAESYQLVTVDNTGAFSPLIFTVGVGEEFPSLLVSKEKDFEDKVASFSSVSLNFLDAVNQSDIMNEKGNFINEEEPVEFKESNGIVFSEKVDEENVNVLSELSSRDITIHLAAESNQLVTIDNAVMLAPLASTFGVVEDLSLFSAPEKKDDENKNAEDSSLAKEDLSQHSDLQLSSSLHFNGDELGFVTGMNPVEIGIQSNLFGLNSITTAHDSSFDDDEDVYQDLNTDSTDDGGEDADDDDDNDDDNDDEYHEYDESLDSTHSYDYKLGNLKSVINAPVNYPHSYYVDNEIELSGFSFPQVFIKKHSYDGNNKSDHLIVGEHELEHSITNKEDTNAGIITKQISQMNDVLKSLQFNLYGNNTSSDEEEFIVFDQTENEYKVPQSDIEEYEFVKSDLVSTSLQSSNSLWLYHQVAENITDNRLSVNIEPIEFEGTEVSNLIELTILECSIKVWSVTTERLEDSDRAFTEKRSKTNSDANEMVEVLDPFKESFVDLHFAANLTVKNSIIQEVKSHQTDTGTDPIDIATDGTDDLHNITNTNPPPKISLGLNSVEVQVNLLKIIKEDCQDIGTDPIFVNDSFNNGASTILRDESFNHLYSIGIQVGCEKEFASSEEDQTYLLLGDKFNERCVGTQTSEFKKKTKHLPTSVATIPLPTSVTTTSLELNRLGSLDRNLNDYQSRNIDDVKSIIFLSNTEHGLILMDPPVSELERLVREKSTIDEYSIINSIQDVATKDLDHGDYDDYQEFLVHFKSVAKASVKPITISPNEEHIHHNEEEMPAIKSEPLLNSIEDPADKVKAAINPNKVEEDVILSTNIHSDHFENDFFFNESGDSSLENFSNKVEKDFVNEKSNDDSDDSNISIDILPDEVSGSDVKTLGNHFDEENGNMLSQLGENNTITEYGETEKKVDEEFVDLLSNEAEADSYILDDFNDVQEFLNYFTSVAKATVKPITSYPNENHKHHNEEELSTIKSKPLLFSLKDPANKVKAAINLNKVEEDVTLSTNAHSDYFENDFFFDESGDSSLEDFPNSVDKKVMDEKSDDDSDDSHIYVEILPDEVNESDDKVLGNHYENLHHNVEEVPTFGDDDKDFQACQKNEDLFNEEEKYAVKKIPEGFKANSVDDNSYEEFSQIESLPVNTTLVVQVNSAITHCKEVAVFNVRDLKENATLKYFSILVDKPTLNVLHSQVAKNDRINVPATNLYEENKSLKLEKEFAQQESGDNLSLAGQKSGDNLSNIYDICKLETDEVSSLKEDVWKLKTPHILSVKVTPKEGKTLIKDKLPISPETKPGNVSQEMFSKQLGIMKSSPHSEGGLVQSSPIIEFSFKLEDETDQSAKLERVHKSVNREVEENLSKDIPLKEIQSEPKVISKNLFAEENTPYYLDTLDKTSEGFLHNSQQKSTVMFYTRIKEPSTPSLFDVNNEYVKNDGHECSNQIIAKASGYEDLTDKDESNNEKDCKSNHEKELKETGSSFSTKHDPYNIEANEVHSQKVELIVGKLKIPDAFSVNVSPERLKSPISDNLPGTSRMRLGKVSQLVFSSEDGVVKFLPVCTEGDLIQNNTISGYTSTLGDSCHADESKAVSINKSESTYSVNTKDLSSNLPLKVVQFEEIAAAESITDVQSESFFDLDIGSPVIGKESEFKDLTDDDQAKSLANQKNQNDGGLQETGPSFLTKHDPYNIEADEVHSQKVELIVGKLKIPDVFSVYVSPEELKSPIGDKLPSTSRMRSGKVSQLVFSNEDGVVKFSPVCTEGDLIQNNTISGYTSILGDSCHADESDAVSINKSENTYSVNTKDLSSNLPLKEVQFEEIAAAESITEVQSEGFYDLESGSPVIGKESEFKDLTGDDQAKSLANQKNHNDGGHQETGASFSMNHVLYNIEADEVHSEKVVSMVAKLKNPDVFSVDIHADEEIDLQILIDNLIIEDRKIQTDEVVVNQEENIPEELVALLQLSEDNVPKIINDVECEVVVEDHPVVDVVVPKLYNSPEIAEIITKNLDLKLKHASLRKKMSENSSLNSKDISPKINNNNSENKQTDLFTTTIRHYTAKVKIEENKEETIDLNKSQNYDEVMPSDDTNMNLKIKENGMLDSQENITFIDSLEVKHESRTSSFQSTEGFQIIHFISPKNDQSNESESSSDFFLDENTIENSFKLTDHQDEYGIHGNGKRMYLDQQNLTLDQRKKHGVELEVDSINDSYEIKNKVPQIVAVKQDHKNFLEADLSNFKNKTLPTACTADKVAEWVVAHPQLDSHSNNNNMGPSVGEPFESLGLFHDEEFNKVNQVNIIKATNINKYEALFLTKAESHETSTKKSLTAQTESKTEQIYLSSKKENISFEQEKNYSLDEEMLFEELWKQIEFIDEDILNQNFKINKEIAIKLANEAKKRKQKVYVTEKSLNPSQQKKGSFVGFELKEERRKINFENKFPITNTSNLLTSSLPGTNICEDSGEEVEEDYKNCFNDEQNSISGSSDYDFGNDNWLVNELKAVPSNQLFKLVYEQPDNCSYSIPLRHKNIISADPNHVAKYIVKLKNQQIFFKSFEDFKKSAIISFKSRLNEEELFFVYSYLYNKQSWIVVADVDEAKMYKVKMVSKVSLTLSDISNTFDRSSLSEEDIENQFASLVEKKKENKTKDQTIIATALNESVDKLLSKAAKMRSDPIIIGKWYIILNKIHKENIFCFNEFLQAYPKIKQLTTHQKFLVYLLIYQKWKVLLDKNSQVFFIPSNLPYYLLDQEQQSELYEVKKTLTYMAINDPSTYTHLMHLDFILPELKHNFTNGFLPKHLTHWESCLAHETPVSLSLNEFEHAFPDTPQLSEEDKLVLFAYYSGNYWNQSLNSDDKNMQHSTQLYSELHDDDKIDFTILDVDEELTENQLRALFLMWTDPAKVAELLKVWTYSLKAVIETFQQFKKMYLRTLAATDFEKFVVYVMIYRQDKWMAVVERKLKSNQLRLRLLPRNILLDTNKFFIQFEDSSLNSWLESINDSNELDELLKESMFLIPFAHKLSNCTKVLQLPDSLKYLDQTLANKRSHGKLKFEEFLELFSEEVQSFSVGIQQLLYVYYQEYQEWELSVWLNSSGTDVMLQEDIPAENNKERKRVNSIDSVDGIRSKLASRADNHLKKVKGNMLIKTTDKALPNKYSYKGDVADIMIDPFEMAQWIIVIDTNCDTKSLEAFKARYLTEMTGVTDKHLYALYCYYYCYNSWKVVFYSPNFPLDHISMLEVSKASELEIPHPTVQSVNILKWISLIEKSSSSYNAPTIEKFKLIFPQISMLSEAEIYLFFCFFCGRKILLSISNPQTQDHLVRMGFKVPQVFPEVNPLPKHLRHWESLLVHEKPISLSLSEFENAFPNVHDLSDEDKLSLFAFQRQQHIYMELNDQSGNKNSMRLKATLSSESLRDLKLDFKVLDLADELSEYQLRTLCLMWTEPEPIAELLTMWTFSPKLIINNFDEFSKWYLKWSSATEFQKFVVYSMIYRQDKWIIIFEKNSSLNQIRLKISLRHISVDSKEFLIPFESSSLVGWTENICDEKEIDELLKLSKFSIPLAYSLNSRNKVMQLPEYLKNHQLHLTITEQNLEEFLEEFSQEMKDIPLGIKRLFFLYHQKCKEWELSVWQSKRSVSGGQLSSVNSFNATVPNVVIRTDKLVEKTEIDTVQKNVSRKVSYQGEIKAIAIDQSEMVQWAPIFDVDSDNVKTFQDFKIVCQNKLSRASEKHLYALYCYHFCFCLWKVLVGSSNQNAMFEFESESIIELPHPAVQLANIYKWIRLIEQSRIRQTLSTIDEFMSFFPDIVELSEAEIYLLYCFFCGIYFRAVVIAPRNTGVVNLSQIQYDDSSIGDLKDKKESNNDNNKISNIGSASVYRSVKAVPFEEVSDYSMRRNTNVSVAQLRKNKDYNPYFDGSDVDPTSVNPSGIEIINFEEVSDYSQRRQTNAREAQIKLNKNNDPTQNVFLKNETLEGYKSYASHALGKSSDDKITKL